MTIEPDDRPGHAPTLFACFLHFDLSFMLWVLLGALGILIAEDLRLSPAQQGMLVALPLLSGSLLRIPLGLLSDRWGAAAWAHRCWPSSSYRSQSAGLPVVPGR